MIAMIAMIAISAINQRAFTAAIAAGQRAAGRDGLIQAGGALLIAVLVLLAARPRLAGYR